MPPEPIVHLNGHLLPLGRAHVSPLDRGFLFGDGIYEGLRAFGGRIVRPDLHARRLAAGLRAARIEWDASQLAALCDELLRANSLRDAFIYVQITRGTPGPGQPLRSRVPAGRMTPTVFAYANTSPPLSAYPPVPTKSAVTLPDLRWMRCDVKSISLIGGVMAAIDASCAGADDAILIRDMPDGRRLVAEGTAANVIAAFPRPGGGCEVVIPPLDGPTNLAGVTRQILLESRPDIVVRPITDDELRIASEVMLTGTLTMVTSVTLLNNEQVGNGVPGPVAIELLGRLCKAIMS